jgi:hypothetical protein
VTCLKSLIAEAQAGSVPSNQSQIAQTDGNQPSPPQEDAKPQAANSALKAFEDKCGVEAAQASNDPKKIQKSASCLQHATNSVVALRMAQYQIELVTTAPSKIHTKKIHELAESAPQPVAGSSGDGYVAEGTQNARNSPSACGDHNGPAHNDYLRVTRSLMRSSEVEDDFGYRIGKRYLTYQVMVTNLNPDHYYLIHDISLDFSSALGAPRGTFAYRASTRDLSLMRGVPEQGADLDPRNLVLHFLQGIGSVAGAVTGLTNFADIMGSSVAAFNGPFLQSFSAILPDHSANQLNRLSDSAFQANTVIDKGRSKSIAVFVPNRIYGLGVDPNLNDVDVCVDGAFVNEISDAQPTVTTVTYPKSDAAPTVGSNVNLSVAGTNLSTDTVLALCGIDIDKFKTASGSNASMSAFVPGACSTGGAISLVVTVHASALNSPVSSAVTATPK